MSKKKSLQNELLELMRHKDGIVVNDLIPYEEIRSKYLEFVERLRSKGELSEVEELKDVVLEYIKLVLMYGTLNEKALLIKELMKYLFPTKREMDMKFSGDIMFMVNPKIVGEKMEENKGEIDDIGDNISEDSDES